MKNLTVIILVGTSPTLFFMLAFSVGISKAYEQFEKLADMILED